MWHLGVSHVMAGPKAAHVTPAGCVTWGRWPTVCRKNIHMMLNIWILEVNQTFQIASKWFGTFNYSNNKQVSKDLQKLTVK